MAKASEDAKRKRAEGIARAKAEHPEKYKGRPGKRLNTAKASEDAKRKRAEGIARAKAEHPEKYKGRPGHQLGPSKIRFINQQILKRAEEVRAVRSEWREISPKHGQVTKIIKMIKRDHAEQIRLLHAVYIKYMATYGLTYAALSRLLDYSFWDYLYWDNNHPHRGMKRAELTKWIRAQHIRKRRKRSQSIESLGYSPADKRQKRPEDDLIRAEEESH